MPRRGRRRPPPWRARARTLPRAGRVASKRAVTWKACADAPTAAPAVAWPPNRSASFSALDSFPSHDYGLIDVERYFAAKGRRQLDYISSQGCRFRCTFCADPFVYERGWTGISAPRMGEELEALWRRRPLRRSQLPGRDISSPTASAWRRCARRSCGAGSASPGRRRCAPIRAFASTTEWRSASARPAAGDGGRRVGVAGDDRLAAEGHHAWNRFRERGADGPPRRRRHLPVHRRLPRRAGRERARRRST